jgi:DNA-binding transcriptional LysR family regulator
VELELRNLKTFLTVARLLNFRKAAEMLNYAQSSVSAQIKILEEELGKPLFQRVGRAVVLTDAGQELLQYAQKITAMEQEAMGAVTGTKSRHGRISLRIPQTIGSCFLPDILTGFYHDHPDVDFDVASCEYQNLPYELKSGITDLAFLLTDSLDLSELKTEFLGTVNLVMISSPDHPLTRKKTVSIMDLSSNTIFLPKHDCSYRMMIEQWLMDKKIKTSSIVEMNSIEAIKQCIIKGLGIAIMPDITAAKEIDQGNLAVLNWDEMSIETAVLMIWYRGKWISPLLKSFMDSVRKVFSETINKP